MAEMTDLKTLFRKQLLKFQQEKCLSEVEFSLDLGKSNGYIQSISSGRNMPSFEMFTEICSYLRREPYEFFIDSENVELIGEIIENLKPMEENELIDILSKIKDS